MIRCSIVEEHVDGEVDAGRGGDRADGVVDRVPLDDAPGRLRVADPPGVVERERRLEPGQARRDHLRTAAEPGEEVRLHEAGRDPQVRLDPLPGEEDRHVVDHAEVDQARPVARVVVDDPPGVEHVLARASRGAPAVVDARWVPVAISTTTSAGRMTPSRTSMIARSISGRGCGRVTSQTEIATRWPGRARSRSRGPATGSSIAVRSVASGSGAASRGRGVITVVAAAGSRTDSPVDP